MRRPAPDAALLTPEAIATAALQVLDTEGPAALSFRRVGAALGTSHTTIHRHCGSFEGLLDVCAEHLAATLPEVDPTLSWARSTELRFTALYEIMRGHAALIALQQGRPWLGPEMTRRFAEPAMAATLAAGMTPAELIESHLAFYMFTLGCALTQRSTDQSANIDALAAIDPKDSPLIAGHRDQLKDRRPEPVAFLRGIRALIAVWDPESRASNTKS
jgi:AcrR family transcriptional regulator